MGLQSPTLGRDHPAETVRTWGQPSQRGAPAAFEEASPGHTDDTGGRPGDGFSLLPNRIFFSTMAAMTSPHSWTEPTPSQSH